MDQDAHGGDGDAADASGRAQPVPGPSTRDWTPTRTSDATEPPPPVDVAAAEAARIEAAGARVAAGAGAAGSGAAGSGASGPGAAGSGAAAVGSGSGAVAAPVAEAAPAPPAGPAVSYDDSPKGAARLAGGPRRPSLPVQGLLAALVAVPLAVAAEAGPVPLLVVVLGLQVLLVLTLLGVLGAPAAGGSAVVAVAAAAAADALVLADDGEVDRVAGVLGLSLVAALLHQLVRRGRSRVTESLADTMLAVVVVAGAACLLALSALDGGQDVLVLALCSAAAVLLVGRLVDRVLPRPGLATGATRGWPGLLASVLAGVGTALGVGASVAGLSLAAAALLGLATAVTVATADLAVDLGAAELRPGRRDARRVAALRPAAALLPYALLGPVVLLAGRLVLS